MVFEIMEKLIERFLEYIAIDTMSDPKSDTVPSSSIQLPLAKKLKEELEEIGLKATLDDKGYVYATLEANTDKKVPVIGFIAHIDTSPALTGGCKNPKFTEYKGGDIKLNEQYSINEAEFPILKKLVGKTIITTDGTTLLGADDKAGVAEIMNALEYLVKHPEIKHGKVVVGFTPDEEIGRGADHFDVKGFGADFAYTMDGGEIGEFQYENFNAASAVIKVQGKSVHPGSGKDVMINSIYIAMELEQMLPKAQRPEHTQDYEGFFMANEINGTIDYTTVEYLIRDHDKVKFEEKKALMRSAVEYINKKYGNVVTLELNDSYYNMKEIVEPHKEIIDLAVKSMENIGITPLVRAIRGGTDGCQLSYKGLPCPNIFAGGYNFHGRFEMIPVEDMIKASELIVEMVKNAAL
ncbi:peptidase T [Johnsonella ignava ATCC 51276]|uniref:Peptidase T n=1 Tax=Johnsonella ignava ATCC 51276 TaxID=679200 RepID=G5GJU4_9FIRM|nr:peptidase T [Johnsonella ignava ATCC 51276]